MTSPQVPRCPADAWQRKQLSDTHAVASQDVAPALELTVPARGSKLAPCAETCTRPAPGALVTALVDALGASYETNRVQVPAITPAVTDRAWLARVPCWTLLVTELTDNQRVASQLVCPPLVATV